MHKIYVLFLTLFFLTACSQVPANNMEPINTPTEPVVENNDEKPLDSNTEEKKVYKDKWEEAKQLYFSKTFKMMNADSVYEYDPDSGIRAQESVRMIGADTIEQYEHLSLSLDEDDSVYSYNKTSDTWLIDEERLNVGLLKFYYEPSNIIALELGELTGGLTEQPSSERCGDAQCLTVVVDSNFYGEGYVSLNEYFYHPDTLLPYKEISTTKFPEQDAEVITKTWEYDIEVEPIVIPNL